eukprot:Amastigsp_a523981_3.p4 type:complete len:117 gc:universal Amastigsp_a523981_3:815-465(-)
MAGVHSFEPSLHLPFHSVEPHGLRHWMSRCPSTSITLRMPYAWPPRMPSPWSCSRLPVVDIAHPMRYSRDVKKCSSRFQNAPESMSARTSSNMIVGGVPPVRSTSASVTHPPMSAE